MQLLGFAAPLGFALRAKMPVRIGATVTAPSPPRSPLQVVHLLPNVCMEDVLAPIPVPATGRADGSGVEDSAVWPETEPTSRGQRKYARSLQPASNPRPSQRPAHALIIIPLSWNGRIV
jgi:hypothetical protein